jgi:hypothetical protein
MMLTLQRHVRSTTDASLSRNSRQKQKDVALPACCIIRIIIIDEPLCYDLQLQYHYSENNNTYCTYNLQQVILKAKEQKVVEQHATRNKKEEEETVKVVAERSSMLGAIRRVISVSDDVGKEEEAQQQQQPQQQSQQQQQEKSPDRAPQRANLVEPDMMDVVGEEDKIMETTYRSGIPVQLIQQRTSSGDSSDDNDNFSDVSMNDAPPMDDDDDNVNMDETLREDSYRLQQPPPASPLQSPHVNAYAPAPPPLGLSRTKSTLQRMESKGAESSQGSMRASSQNSSRDWGWFEDVHLQHSDRGLDGGTEKAKHKKKTTANSASSPARIEAAVQDIILQQHHQIIKDTGTFIDSQILIDWDSPLLQHTRSPLSFFSCSIFIYRRCRHGSHSTHVRIGGISLQPTTLERHGRSTPPSTRRRTSLLRKNVVAKLCSLPSQVSHARGSIDGHVSYIHVAIFRRKL